jgi:hypothetical protein
MLTINQRRKSRLSKDKRRHGIAGIFTPKNRCERRDGFGNRHKLRSWDVALHECGYVAHKRINQNVNGIHGRNLSCGVCYTIPDRCSQLIALAVILRKTAF